MKKQMQTSILARTSETTKCGHQYSQGPVQKANAGINISKDLWKHQTRTSMLAGTNDKSKCGHQYWQGPLTKANADVNISKDQWKMQNAGINIGKDQWTNKMRASIFPQGPCTSHGGTPRAARNVMTSRAKMASTYRHVPFTMPLRCLYDAPIRCW